MWKKQTNRSFPESGRHGSLFHGFGAPLDPKGFCIGFEAHEDPPAERSYRIPESINEQKKIRLINSEYIKLITSTIRHYGFRIWCRSVGSEMWASISFIITVIFGSRYVPGAAWISAIVRSGIVLTWATSCCRVDPVNKCMWKCRNNIWCQPMLGNIIFIIISLKIIVVHLKCNLNTYKLLIHNKTRIWVWH